MSPDAKATRAQVSYSVIQKAKCVHIKIVFMPPKATCVCNSAICNSPMQKPAKCPLSEKYIENGKWIHIMK